jgi:hypothetical protein
MIIVKMQGGLGNQLFQYSFGRYLEKKLDTVVQFDVNWYNGAKFKLEIKSLGLEINRCSIIDYLKIFGVFVHPKIAGKANSILSVDAGYISETNEPQYTDNKYYDGYWQKYRFVKESIDFLRDNIFVDRSSSGIQPFKKNNTVALHIRGGDYFKSDNHIVLGIEYYRKAVNQIKEKVEKPQFHVFTNDIKYAKEIISKLELSNYNVISSSDATHDFLKMTTCNHYITANSTYSWWAAVLGKGSTSDIFAPSCWKVDKIDNQLILNNLIPENWNII